MSSPITWCERDIVQFCQRLQHQSSLDATIAQAKHCKLTVQLDFNHLMKNGDFVPIIRWLWCHGNTKETLKWLQSHTHLFHAPLLYEQAIAEFAVQSTAQTLHLLSLPLIKAASFRALQDCSCLRISRESSDDIIDKLEKSYLTCLETMALKTLGDGVEQLDATMQEARDRAIKIAISSAAQYSITTEPQTNNWLRWYGKDDDNLTEIPIPHAQNPQERIQRIAESVIRKFQTC